MPIQALAVSPSMIELTVIQIHPKGIQLTCRWILAKHTEKRELSRTTNVTYFRFSLGRMTVLYTPEEFNSRCIWTSCIGCFL